MIPPITAAIRTPKAPTPPLSSAAGGFEKVDEPVDLAPLPDELALVRLDALEDPVEDVEDEAAL